MDRELQDWYREWLTENKGTDLLYVSRDARGVAYLAQVHFVRDTLARLVWGDVPYEKLPLNSDGAHHSHVSVIGEHTSKSVRLPVYSIERSDLGIRFVLRDNYHDWNVSVTCSAPVSADLDGFVLDYTDEERDRFPNGYIPGRSWGYCFFQGFPEEMQFGPYMESSRRFSLCIGSDYELYAFVRLVMQWLRKERHIR